MAKKEYDRRKFLKHLGLGAAVASSPLEIFLDSLVEGVVSKALAAGANKNPNKYICIVQGGAPPRWMFDLFLKPYGGTVMPNASVVSEYKASGGRYTDAVYKTYNVKGIQAPIMWTHSIATSRGTRPLSDMMNNMLVLQGMDTFGVSHLAAYGFLNQPLTSASIDGVLADHSDLPFASVNLAANGLKFTSAQGKLAKNFRRGAKIEELLLGAFKQSDHEGLRSHKHKIQRAIASLNQRITSSKLAGGSVNDSLENAYKLMHGGLKGIDKEIPALEIKYQKLIDATVALSKNLRGITDRPIGSSSGRGKTYNYRTEVVKDGDLRSLINGASVRELARGFAGMEYLLTHNLTSSVSISTRALLGQLAGKASEFSNDQHGTGKMVSLVTTVVYFRIISTCVQELIHVLKNTNYQNSNMFDYSVLRIGGEFNRSPRGDGSGSDHAPKAASSMFLSGMIDGPVVAGNILKDGRKARLREGSWGVGAPLEHNSPGTVGHVVSTLAEMLDVPSPSVNNPSLVIKDKKSNKVRLNEAYIKKTKVV